MSDSKDLLVASIDWWVEGIAKEDDRRVAREVIECLADINCGGSGSVMLSIYNHRRNQMEKKVEDFEHERAAVGQRILNSTGQKRID